MTPFDEKTASADELWDYYMLEYTNPNPAVKILIDNYYAKLNSIISSFDPGYRLLEVGCGPGESSRKIHSMLRGQYFETSEFDDRLVMKLNETNPPFKVSQESVYSLKRADKSFDVVFLLEVLEHVEDYQLAVQELFRVAKKFVVLSVPNEPLWSMLNLMRGKYLREGGNTPGHVNRWSKNSLTKLVSPHGMVEAVKMPVPWIIMKIRVGI